MQSFPGGFRVSESGFPREPIARLIMRHVVRLRCTGLHHDVRLYDCMV